MEFRANRIETEIATMMASVNSKVTSAVEQLLAMDVKNGEIIQKLIGDNKTLLDKIRETEPDYKLPEDPKPTITRPQ